MPYRVDIPEGKEALEHILNHLGTSKLVESKKVTMRLMYEAPETTLSPREREVVRYPGTLVMGCPICNNLRMWRDWPGFCEEPIAEELYANAGEFNWNWDGFSKREALVLEFTYRFYNAIEDLNGDDEFWERMHEHFSDAEIGDLCIMCGTWLGTGHMLKALGIGSVCPLPVTEETLSRLRNDSLQIATG